MSMSSPGFEFLKAEADERREAMLCDPATLALQSLVILKADVKVIVSAGNGRESSAGELVGEDFSTWFAAGG